jgi:hypothetical protein
MGSARRNGLVSAVQLEGWVSMSEPDDRPRRFFISYRRRAADDARLAKLLVERLRGAGHEVFIDVEMPIGTDWSAETTRRIQWCDYLVVLLSEDSMDSEMVQGEVRLARHYRREDGSPFIFPIRVRYEGALDYELDAYVGRFQHIVWSSVADDPIVLGALLAAARRGQGPNQPHASAESASVRITADERRPRPSVDPTASLRPTGTLRLDDRF